MSHLEADTVNVSLGDRSYPIHIGANLLAVEHLTRLLAPHILGVEVLVLTNPTVAPLYVSRVLEALTQYRVDVFEMADGEQYKSLASYGEVQAYLLEKKHSRSTTIIALGGGVVGDLAGFVAATYQRGVNFIQVPTTLLAQVDSSVGGKTAVNHPLGKNMIGAFYQPRAVVIDTLALDSLPPREFAAGMAEVIKYGVIADAEFFNWLEENAPRLASKDAGALQQAIRRACEIKAEVVALDEREGGMRAILNFGHTFAHAIETLSGYGAVLHGEAVAIGMVMAATLSERIRLAPQGTATQISRLLRVFELPVDLLHTQSAEGTVDYAPESMLEKMAMDKKAEGGRMRFVLTRGLGSADVQELTSPQDVGSLDAVLSEFALS